MSNGGAHLMEKVFASDHITQCPHRLSRQVGDPLHSSDLCWRQRLARPDAI